MHNNLIARTSVHINSASSTIWDALTKPELIEQYFFGTRVQSDWKVGNPIIFKGEWEGKEYTEKGIILKNEPEKVLQYNYFNPLSGLEDVPENYAIITFELTKENKGITLTVSQDKIASPEAKHDSEQNWGKVLTGLKELVEKILV